MSAGSTNAGTGAFSAHRHSLGSVGPAPQTNCQTATTTIDHIDYFVVIYSSSCCCLHIKKAVVGVLFFLFYNTCTDPPRVLTGSSHNIYGRETEHGCGVCSGVVCKIEYIYMQQ